MDAPDWSLFRTAYASGLPQGRFLRDAHKIESWLELPPEEALAALERERPDSVRAIHQVLCVLRQKLQRDAGVPEGLEGQAHLQRIFTDVEQGRGTEVERRFCDRLFSATQLSAELLKIDPTLNAPSSSAEQARHDLQELAVPIFERLNATMSSASAGVVSPELLREIEQALEDYQRLIAHSATDNPARKDIFYHMGHAALSLAKHCITARRYDEARARFKQGTEWFELGGDTERAEACRTGARELNQRVSGQLDDAVERHLATLIAPAKSTDPFRRIDSLVDLAAIAANASDVVEAVQHAESAAAALVDVGYPDPEKQGVDAAVARWILTATHHLGGADLFGRLAQVGTAYMRVLTARHAERIRTDVAHADRTLTKLQGVQAAIGKAGEEMAIAVNETERAWARYFPSMPLAPRGGTSAVNSEFDALMARMRFVDTALENVRQQCNQRIGTGESMDDLLVTITTIEAEADTLNSPLHEARCRLERAYVLLHASRAVEMQQAAREARSRLLAGREAKLSSFTHLAERYSYLESLSREVIAGIMQQDFTGALDLCEATIRDFETERYRINSPYRQSARLSHVAEFYRWAAFAAFKLGRWDNMLEAIELIKARSALRSRLIESTAAAPETLSTAELTDAFNQASVALDKDPKDADLVARRRHLWDLLSMARVKQVGAHEIPKFNVVALQATIAADEALIGFFWLSESTILTVAVDRDRFVAERINLDADGVERLDEFVSLVRGLDTVFLGMDNAVRRLGEILLPKFLRDFIADKQRLMLSPHRALHLFPFHAATWGKNEYVGTRFAIRYVPNFSSLLLPWHGQTENRVLAIGIGRVSDSRFETLTNVEEDVGVIRDYYRGRGIPVESLLGVEASRSRIEALRANGDLGRFRCVHLGTHGVSVFETPTAPMEARVLLQDSALDAMTIAGLRLNAELVVLSACNSGQRAIEARDLGELPGDDIFGLQSALFQSGVHTVLGSLWVVETRSSSFLIKSFHWHYAAGCVTEEALRRALRDYLADPATAKNVYYWAPYFLSSLGATPPAPFVGDDGSPWCCR
jgi:hypothetical protein